MFIQEARICPTSTDLLRYAQNHLSESDMNQIRNHVNSCTMCTQALESLHFAGSAQAPTGGSSKQVHSEDLKGLFASRVAHFRQLLQFAQPEQGRFGQIWTTKPWSVVQRSDPEEDMPLRIIVLLEDESDTSVLNERFLVAAPISLDIAYQSNYDLMVSEQESPLGYPFMVEPWNSVSLLRAQLERCLGTLQQPVKRFLGLVYRASLGMSVDVSEVVQSLGPAILHPDDPRIPFQEQEREACDYLRQPLLQLLKRAEATASEANRRGSIVLLRRELPVIHGQLPPVPAGARTPLPLAAAAAQTQVPSHYIYAQSPDGDVLGWMKRDLGTDSLYMVWEHLPQTLQGTTVSISLHLDTGTTRTVAESPVYQGEQTLLSKGEHLRPAQITSFELEFRG